MSDIPKFSFTLFRFTGPKGQRSTETVRDLAIAHGMRTMVEFEQSVEPDLQLPDTHHTR